MREKYFITHYLPLFAVLVATAVGLILFPYDKPLRIALSIAMGVSYVFWGLVHHYIHKDLSFEIAAEYILIATFGVVAVILVLV